MEQLAQRIQFRLIGTWWSIPLNSEPASTRAIDRIVRTELGVSDEHATVRARMRRELSEAARLARDSDVILMLMSTQLPNGTPMPLTITVARPENMRMSPAIGVGAEQVLSVLEESLPLIDPAAHEHAVRREYDGGMTLRTHEIIERHFDDDTGVVRELGVNYWYPIPGTKHLMLVHFATALGDIQQVMLQYTDAIVRTSYFSVNPTETVSATRAVPAGSALSPP